MFILTIAVVIATTNRFYTERVREELQAQLQSHAKFLLEEYQESCVTRESDACQKFLKRLEEIRPLRFWILSRSGQTMLSNSSGAPPRLNASDFRKAQEGEAIFHVRHRMPSFVLVPLKDGTGNVQEFALIERAMAGRRRFGRFPFIAFVLIVLITIAVLIFPLSKRLTKPLRELHSMGKEWAEGRLEKRAKIPGKDEIAELGATFNTMAKNLQKMLDQRKEFMAAISHELKSPLARIRIALELLNEKNTNQIETLQLLQKIEREVEESEQLIEQLLSLSKIELNASLEKDSISLAALTRRAIEQLNPLADRASVQFRVNGDAMVVADSTQLERAILNVMENAVRYSAAGMVVDVHIQKEKGHFSWKCVDQGSGIEIHESEKIFQPFYRGIRAADKEGTGLGLFIAKRIVDLHAGRIRAFKNDTAGLTVEIQLPA